MTIFDILIEPISYIQSISTHAPLDCYALSSFMDFQTSDIWGLHSDWPAAFKRYFFSICTHNKISEMQPVTSRHEGTSKMSSGVGRGRAIPEVIFPRSASTSFYEVAVRRTVMTLSSGEY